MCVFYLNAQGLAKDGARAKLKELYNLHKPNIIFIAEPMGFCTTCFVRSLKLDDFSEDVITNELAVMLKMKSRITWMEDGDQNTNFFTTTFVCE